MRLKKTDRPGTYPPERRAQWVAHAIRTSIADAARTFGVCEETVRKHCRAAGHAPRRPGAPATYGPALIAKVVAHAKRNTVSKTASAFSVSQDTVRRFLRLHGEA